MSDEKQQRPETFAEAVEVMRRSWDELIVVAFAPLVDPVEEIARILKRKRKIVAAVDHPDYFYTAEELEISDMWGRVAVGFANTGVSAQEAADAFVGLFRAALPAKHDVMSGVEIPAGTPEGETAPGESFL